MKSLLEVALSQYGVKEVVGLQNNPAIVNYAHDIGMSWVASEDVAWCSIFMNWCAMKAGVVRSAKANARSWLVIGQEVTEPQTGDIVVFKRGSSTWEGHVGIYINEHDGFINVLGGNQGDMVKISAYTKSDLLGYRRL